MARQKDFAVVGYLRVSGRGQLEGHGFDRQEETIGAWSRHAGATVTRCYREEGISGAKDETHSWRKQPGLCRSANRHYDCIPSTRNDRLGFRVARSQLAQ